MRRVNGEVEQGKDGLELRGAFVKKRHVLNLRSESCAKRGDEAVKVRVEDDELPENR